MLNICSITSLACTVDQAKFNVSATKTEKLNYVRDYNVIGFLSFIKLKKEVTGNDKASKFYPYIHIFTITCVCNMPSLVRFCW